MNSKIYTKNDFCRKFQNNLLGSGLYKTNLGIAQLAKTCC